MTIDTLAVATEQEFQKIHKEFRDVHAEMAGMKTEMVEMKTTMTGMATKEELKSTESRILLAIEKMDARLSAYMARTNEDISKLQGSDRDFDVRLRVMEKRG